MSSTLSMSDRVHLMTSLGQMTQLRAYSKSITKEEIKDLEYPYVSLEIGIMIVLDDLEVDLFARLSKFVKFLEDQGIINSVELEVDLEDYNTPYFHTVLLTPQGEIILLSTTNPNKKYAQERIMIEWIKRIESVSH